MGEGVPVVCETGVDAEVWEIVPFKDAEAKRQYQREYSRVWYQANKQKKNAQSAAWRLANTDRSREIARDSYKRNSTRPQRVYLTEEQRRMSIVGKWRRQSWRRYGIDVEKAAAVLAAHDGKCGICRADTPAKRRRDWCVDHDHRTLHIRGVLCHSCNMKLGWVDRVGLAAIENYLAAKR